MPLTDGREWFPISFHKSRPVKNPTVKNVKMPVYLVLIKVKQNGIVRSFTQAALYKQNNFLG